MRDLRRAVAKKTTSHTLVSKDSPGIVLFYTVNYTEPSHTDAYAHMAV